MGKPEGEVENYLKNLCHVYDVLYYKFMSGVRGVPDRILIGQGKTIFVELKRPGETPRLSQVVLFDDIKCHGGHVYVVDSKTNADKLMHRLFVKPKKEKPSYGNAYFKINKL